MRLYAFFWLRKVHLEPIFTPGTPCLTIYHPWIHLWHTEGARNSWVPQRFTELEESPGSLQARLIQRRRYIWKSVVVSGWHSRERARGHDRTSTCTVSCTLYGAASVHGGCWLGWGRLWGSKMSALQGIPTSPGEPSKTHHNWDGTKQNIPVFYIYVSLANMLPIHWSQNKSSLIEAQLTRKVYRVCYIWMVDKLC